MTLRAEAVRKRFDDRLVLAEASLTLVPGEVVLLSGANGSGKTTFARILATLLTADGGEVLIDGFPVSKGRARARRSIGLVTHQPLLYLGLTPVENLDLFGGLTGVRDARGRGGALLDRLGLKPFRNVPLSRFSRGMLQRVALARAFLHEPRLLILDEPYSGLDDDGAATVNALLREAGSRGAAALLIAHERERAAALTTRALRLRGGRVEVA